MKYRDGYLCGYDDLTQLPVDILEDIIIRIYQDGLHCICAYSGAYPFTFWQHIKA